MIIKIKKDIKYVNMWYNESQGREFNAWENSAYPGFYFVDTQLFIPAEDIESIRKDDE